MHLDFHLIESKPIILKDGHPHKLIFTYQDPEFGNLKTMITVIIRDSRTYEIVYHSHPQNYSTAEKVAQNYDIDTEEDIPDSPVYNRLQEKTRLFQR